MSRVVCESWVARQAFCPACGGALASTPPNTPVEDFTCRGCPEVFELKSKKGSFGAVINDGAYASMLNSLQGLRNPNFFLLNYDLDACRVRDFIVVPKQFFVPAMIIKRPPLGAHARRRGWVGCNIRYRDVPEAGRLYYIRNGTSQAKPAILKAWKKVGFLRRESAALRGWTLDVMRCVERIGRSEFALSELYRFEAGLAARHPSNRFVKEKVRQQLQVLRDHGYLRFIAPGRYRRVD